MLSANCLLHDGVGWADVGWAASGFEISGGSNYLAQTSFSYKSIRNLNYI